MSDTPNNEMEKQLRDYARERRAAAGTPQLHPATRRMLQAEVRQQFGKPEQAAGSGRWRIIWPRFAMGSAVLASLVAMFVVVNRTEHPQTDAKFKLAKSEGTENALMPAASMELASEPVGGRKEADAEIASTGLLEPLADAAIARSDAAKGAAFAGVATTSDVSSMDVSTAPNEMVSARGAPTPAPAMPSAKASLAGVNEMKVSIASPPPSRVMTKTAKVSAVPPGSIAPGGTVNSVLNNSTTQRFFNTAVETASSPTRAHIVLGEFVVEQMGNSLKIVDRDGSVYRGNIQVATNVTSAFANTDSFAGQALQTTPASAAVPVSPSGSHDRAIVTNVLNQQVPVSSPSVQNIQSYGVEPVNYAFEVEGTNRSLRQRVVFNGNWFQNVTPLNAQNASNLTQNFQSQAAPAVQSEELNYNLQNNFINGRVYLGNSRNGTELNALPMNDQRR